MTTLVEVAKSVEFSTSSEIAIGRLYRARKLEFRRASDFICARMRTGEGRAFPRKLVLNPINANLDYKLLCGCGEVNRDTSVVKTPQCNHRLSIP